MILQCEKLAGQDIHVLAMNVKVNVPTLQKSEKWDEGSRQSIAEVTNNSSGPSFQASARVNRMQQITCVDLAVFRVRLLARS